MVTQVGKKHLQRNPYNKSQEKEVSSENSMLEYLSTKRNLENVMHEMVQLGINVLGMSDTRWPGEDVTWRIIRIIHSGGEESQRGVAIILDKRTTNCVENVRCEGDRVLMVKLKEKPVDMCIIQVYIPTTEHSEEEC